MKSLSGKPKKCKECGESFVPNKPMQKVCSVACAITHAKTTGEAARKRDREKQVREAKQKLKGRIEYAKEAQQIFNRYIRLRDAKLPCVSCNRPASWAGQWHASHYRSVGAAPHLRFNLLNVHKACSVCNNHLSGNITGYRPELLKRIGSEKLSLIECCNSVAKHDIDYLKRIKTIFHKKCKKLERKNEVFG